MRRKAWLSGALALALLLTGASAARAQSDGEGAWNLTGALAADRAGHTATLLGGPACSAAARPAWCGKVLVAGGTTDEPAEDPPNVAVASAELYDPRTGSWTATGMLKVARSAHTATLLSNGKVLVAGGHATNSAGEPLASAELYDPATGDWTSCTNAAANANCPGPLAGERYDHTATLLANGRVLVAGAATDLTSDPNYPTAEVYDPATGKWTKTTGDMNQLRYQHTATLLPNGKVLVTGGTLPEVFGGQESSETKFSSELYDPATGAWESCFATTPNANCPGDLGQGRYGHTITPLPDGRLLAAGGGDNAGNHRSSEVYNPATGAWSLSKLLNQPRYGHGAALLPNGRVLVAGGRGPGLFSALGSAELYRPGAPGTRWNVARFMSTPRGSDFERPRSVPAVLLSSETGRFAADAAVCGANCGRVLLVGGLQEDLFEAVSSAELYTPVPSIAGVSPGSAPTRGGSRITITGTGFTHGTSAVTFDGVPARGFRVESYSRISAVTPSHDPDVVELRVTNQGGTASASFAFHASSSRSLAGCPPARAARNTIALTGANDRRRGTPVADLIFAGAGNDRIDGLAGNDCIDLEAGRDRGNGGRGNDFVLGKSGNDRISGSGGRDRLAGGAGRDRLSGGSSSDRLAGNSGDDRISGGSGRDRISGSSGDDRIAAADDTRDRIACGSGRDSVTADRIDRVSRSCERVRRR